MKTLKILILISISLLKLSCGEASKDMTSLEFDTRSFLTSEEGETKITLFGQSNTGDFFSRNLDEALTTRLELPNGEWQFYVLTWSGEEREVKCGVSHKRFLNGLSIAVDLVVNNHNCLDKEFGAINGVDMGGASFFPELRVEDANVSYKIKLYSMDNFQGVFLKRGTSSYETECLNNDSYKINLPFLFSELPFHYVIEKYDGTTCENVLEEKNLPHNSSMIEYDEDDLSFTLSF